MNIELSPKYQIGHKINKEIYLDNKHIGTRHFVISNIKAIYNFNKNKIEYSYLLKYDDEEFEYEYGWAYLEDIVTKE